MKSIRFIWDLYERLLSHLLGLEPVVPDSMLRVRTVIYRGEPLRHGDQQLLAGMRVLDLHLNNLQIARLGRTGVEATLRVRSAIRDELPALLALLRSAQPPVMGVIGTGLLAAGARTVSFHVQPLPPSLWHRWLTIYMNWLDRLYRPGEPPPGRHRQRRDQVCVAWLSAADLATLVQRSPGRSLEGKAVAEAL